MLGNGVYDFCVNLICMVSRPTGVGYSLLTIERSMDIYLRVIVITREFDLTNKIQQNLGPVADSPLKLIKCVI